MAGWLVVATCVAPLVATKAAAGGVRGIEAVELETEHAREPLAVETDAPRLSWQLVSDVQARGKRQMAYRVVVGRSAAAVREQKGLLWDSGRVESAAIEVAYGGPKLTDLGEYFWSVRVWDEKGTEAGWSEPARFTVGARHAADWDGAKWIAGREWVDAADTAAPPTPELRRAFAVRKAVAHARLDVSGLGYYSLLLDGLTLDDRVLAPGWTSVDKRVLYDTYDVTEKMKAAEHALGVTLGRGFYANAGGVVHFIHPGPWSSADPKMILRLRLEYVDGTSENIVSDATWTTHDGPTVANFAYQGETYDARNETPGWAKAQFDAAGWQPARVVDGPPGVLSAEILDPIRVVETVNATELNEIKPGVWRFTFPTVKAGWAELRLKGPAGAKVVMKYAERLNADGTANNNGDPGITPGEIQVDSYVLRGDTAGEVWQPRYSFKSFAYVQVEGYPGKPALDSVAMKVLHTDLASAGTFECSSKVLNAIQAMVLRSTLSNFQSIPSDTPMYEKRGWLGDAQVMTAAAIQNFELQRFYESRVQGIVDDESDAGMVSDLVPTMRGPASKYIDNAWSSALITIPWQMYLDYGDNRVLTEHYAAMAKYVNFASSQAVDGILGGQYGDWLPPTGPMPGDVKLVETAYLYLDAIRMAEIAKVVGRAGDVAHWEKMASGTLSRFNAVFLNRDKKMYFNVGDTEYHQTANALPLAFGMVPEELKEQVADQLAADVVARGNHLNTGVMGTKELLPVLSATGHADLALAIATQTTQPSWGYMLESTAGRTGLWEAWGFKGVRSRNHMMYGTVGDWMYEDLAGIRPVTPGYATFAVEPDYPVGLDWVKATRKVPAGEIVAAWKRVGPGVALDVTVPVNTMAEVSLPVMAGQKVLESGKAVSVRDGVVMVSAANGRETYRVGSGRYEFQSE